MRGTHREPLTQRLIATAIGTHPVTVQWGLLELSVPLGAPIKDLHSAIWFKAPEAMSRFQEMYPDRYHFRVKLIDQALRYEQHHPENVRFHMLVKPLLLLTRIQAVLIAEARQFLTLALLIAHPPCARFQVATGKRLSARDEHTIRYFIKSEVDLLLASLLEYSLKNLLDKVQGMISAGKRADWPAVCFALCLLFFGAESMQVDIHLRSTNPEVSCEAMEMRSILVLADLFSAMTLHFDPLNLDWSRTENQALLDGDVEAVESLRGLQELSQDYCGFSGIEIRFQLLIAS